jgi:hypothetical protein
MKLKYLLNYLNERFPFINMMLFCILYAMVLVVYQMLIAPIQHSIYFHVLGLISVISFFFRLRVFDEMKDYQIDLVNHPNRILQSGKINLRTLQILAFTGFLVEITWAYVAGTSAQITWLLALLYSILMRYEFFIPKLLNKNLLVYAISHMVIMPLIIIWIWGSFNTVFVFHQGILYLLLLSLLSGFAFEVARKTHAPEAERSTVDSYSKQIGLRKTQYLIICLAIGMCISLMLLFALLKVTMFLYLFSALICVWVIVAYLITLKKPSEQAFRNNEKKVSLMMLISYLSLILLYFI